ncbi:glycine receptor subunit alpha-3-like [Centruroides sculpturatus]|uniref:glycine receptor subunit alpha-3-like n=1 Tax=Centruroides sculpturatus TaxID=218467 RepID=UPI000C6D6B74|nr:glycine receptor subunit alpha-3-like [Centruroides sculpturatus]
MVFYAALMLLLITFASDSDDMEIVPKDYNRDLPPIINDLPVPVYVSCQILGIDSINEASMDFRLLLLIISVWKDPRLNLKHIVSEYPVVFPSGEREKIWMPKFGFPNSKKIEKFDETTGFSVVKVLKDESLYGVLRTNLLVDCPMELHDYPMDVQICQFLISIKVYTDKETVLKWLGEEGSPYQYLGKSVHIRNINLLKFQMNDVQTKKYTAVWVSGNFTTLIAEFKFTRRLTGNLMNVYIPSTLVVMLSWLSFWIDVHAAPARITLGVTSILTLVTHLVQSRSFVPPVDYLKALDVWFIFCIVLIFLSLLEYALAYNFVLKKRTAKETRVRAFRPDSKEKESRLVKVWISYLKDKTSTLIEAKDLNVYDKVSRYLFPFVFVNFASFYCVYYLSNRDL